MNYYLLGILFLLLISFVSKSEPLISEPTFSRLSTENGLTQDTINSLLFDSEGFLWIGTDEGLNRFDGYQNQQVFGPNNEFLDTPISYIFQDSKENLWISDYINGVHQYNLKSNTAQKIVNLRVKYDDQLTQEASYISEDKEGNIILSLDEGVFSYSYVTNKLSIEYSLPDEIIKNVGFVRTHLLSQDILFVGTSAGLYAVVRGKKEPLFISHLHSVEQTIDNMNVKVLYADDQDTLWIGTVEGLFSLSLSQARQFVLGTRSAPEAELRIENRNIWKLGGFNNESFYAVTDKGLYRYQTKSNELQHLFLPSDSRDYISSDVLTDLIIDSNDNIWLGSEADGAIYWSPKTTIFNNVYNTKGGREKKILSHNNIWSLHQQDEYSLWVGTRNGLNLYNLSDGTTQSFLVSDDEKAKFSPSSITSIEAGKDGQLWLNTGSGIILFDSKTGKTFPLKINSVEDDAILKSEIWDIFNTSEGALLLSTVTGFFSYSPDTGKVNKMEQLSASIDPRNAVGFSARLGNYGRWKMPQPKSH
jgi:ligand-binding sensor domain-containing protein